MCGIAGTDRLTPQTAEILPYLLWEMEARGQQSWGATNGRDLHKEAVSVLAGMDRVRILLEAWEGDPVVFHTRAPSVGEISVPNAHPFAVTAAGALRLELPVEDCVVGVHNGGISNWSDLNTKHNREYEVDSMHLFANLAAGLDVKELTGWGAAVWFDNIRTPGVLNFCKFRGGTLEFVRLKTGELVFCSTEAPLLKGARLLGGVRCGFNLEQGVHYVVEPEGDEGKIKKLGEFNTGVTMVEGGGYGYFNHIHSGHGRRGGWSGDGSYYSRSAARRDPKVCIECLHTLASPKNALVCDTCESKLLGRTAPYGTETLRVFMTTPGVPPATCTALAPAGLVSRGGYVTRSEGLITTPDGALLAYGLGDPGLGDD